MDKNYEERNKTQIIRVDAKACFVESRSDTFNIGKVHLEFATYDAKKPAGQRQTNHVNIYIDIPEFLCLANEAMTGMLHARARQQRAKNDENTPLYECLGGTSADRLKQLGRSRPDGKSLSRTAKLKLGRNNDTYVFVASSGPGETSATGLIVPKFGSSPENNVLVMMTWRSVNEFLLTTVTHYQAWLAAKYMSEGIQNTKKPYIANNGKPPSPAPTTPRGSQSQPGTVQNPYDQEEFF
jgi:hypothetical protein